MIWLLLVLYQLKHFVADYPLQGKYMLGKFKPFPDCLGPLAAHAAVHAAFTYLIAKACGSSVAGLLALLDALVHAGVDYLKANPNLGGRFKPLTKETYPGSTPEQQKSNVYFWWALGADQMAHHLTHYGIIALILVSR